MPGPVIRRPRQIDNAWIDEGLTVDFESYQSLRTATNRPASGLSQIVQVDEAQMAEWRRRMNDLHTRVAESILDTRRGRQPFSYWPLDEKPAAPKDLIVVNLLSDPKDRA